MANQQKKVTKTGSIHPNNPHKGRYDLTELCKICPELADYIKPNPDGDDTVDFSSDKAVLFLNKALLAKYYNVANWQIPAGYLCPPIPGRADYIHYLADLLAKSNQNNIPKGKKVKVLDVGTGANCIYPIIGSQSYGWHFVGSDIDQLAMKTATLIIQSNSSLTKMISLVHQKDRQNIFKNIIKDRDRFDLTICNPPFHASEAEAQAGNQRKVQNLNKGKHVKKTHIKPNFGGQKAELWCPGGEIYFLNRTARESVEYAEQVCWFTSLVSKKENVEPLSRLLNQLGAKQIETIKMAQGQKVSRFVAWTFLTPKQQIKWAQKNWG